MTSPKSAFGIDTKAFDDYVRQPGENGYVFNALPPGVQSAMPVSPVAAALVPGLTSSSSPQHRKRAQTRLSSQVLPDGRAHVSLLVPTRLAPPDAFQAPRRVVHEAAKVTYSKNSNEDLFNRIKLTVKSDDKDTKLDHKADFTMLARATSRAGDAWKRAISYYNLGVAHDNVDRFSDAIEAYKRFIRAVEAIANMDSPQSPKRSHGNVHPLIHSISPQKSSPQRSSPQRSSPTRRPDSSFRSPSSFGSYGAARSRSRDGRQSSFKKTPKDGKTKNRPISPSEALALGHNSLAIDYGKMGDLASALIHHAKHAQVSNDSRSRGIALCNAGLVHRNACDLEFSDQCFRKALHLARENDDSVIEMLACGHLGLNAANACVTTESASYWTTSITKQQTQSSSTQGAGTDRKTLPGAQNIMSLSTDECSDAIQRRLLTEEEISNAREALLACLSLQSKEDDPRNIAAAHSALGVLAHSQGRYLEALDSFEAARDAAQTYDSSKAAAKDKCHIGIAAAHTRMQEHFKRLVANLDE